MIPINPRPAFTLLLAIATFCLGCGLLYIAVSGVRRGEVAVMGRNVHRSVREAEHPGRFWGEITIYGLGAVLLCGAGVKTAAGVLRK